MKKRVLSILMALFMTFSIFSTVTFGAYAKETVIEVVTNDEQESKVISFDGAYEYFVKDSKATISDYLLPELSENYTIPEAIDGYPVNVIADEAFCGISGLENLTIPDGVESIGKKAFYLTAVQSINIGSGLKTIGAAAFSGGNALETITISADNENYTVTSNVLYTKDMKTLVQYPSVSTATEFEIPETVETLEVCSFGSTTLDSITIPDTVLNFGDDVFYLSEKTITIICSSTSEAAKYAEKNQIKTRYTDVVLATDLKLNATAIRWPVGKAGHFKPTVTPEGASTILKWTSSDPLVATVSESGKLTAVSEGTAKITVETTDGSNLSASCNVIVGAKVEALKLNATTIRWNIGKSGHFKPTVTPSDAVNKSLSWTSSNSKVATVNANGKLTAVSEGTAVITCKTTDGSNLSATCRVIVGNSLATSLKLNASLINWSIGKSGHFKPKVSPAAAANQTLEWTSSNPRVAIVSEKGKLSAVGIGTTIITCRTTDGSDLEASCVVTIGRLVTNVKLNATKITWPAGKSGSFKPTVTPSNAANKTLSWTSSDPSVATVSTSGKLTAKAPGTTTITCKATDGSGKYATCKVTVTAVKATGLKLNTKSIVWEAGKSGSFKPTITPSNATNKNLKWESLNPEVATVSSSGKLTAVSSGTAKIVCSTTDGSDLKAYCQVLVTKSGEPQNYTQFFRSFIHDGTYAINGTTEVSLDSGDIYTMTVQIGATLTESYMYEYDKNDQTTKTVFGPDGSLIILYGLKLSDMLDISQAELLGFPTKYFYNVKDYYIVYDETPFYNYYLENLTYKYTDTDVVDDIELTAEHFAAEGENSEAVFYFKDGRLRYFEMKNENESIMIKVTSAQGTFKYSDYRKPSGSVEIDLSAWFDII